MRLLGDHRPGTLGARCVPAVERAYPHSWSLMWSERMTSSGDGISETLGRGLATGAEVSPHRNAAFGARFRTARVAQLFRRHTESISRVTRILELRRGVVSGSHDCPPPLDLALDTVATIAALRDVVASHTIELVAIARESGAMWNEIGDALGISKQAAHERYRRSCPHHTNRTAAR